jgi:hypothetical protein
MLMIIPLLNILLDSGNEKGNYAPSATKDWLDLNKDLAGNYPFLGSCQKHIVCSPLHDVCIECNDCASIKLIINNNILKNKLSFNLNIKFIQMHKRS